MDPVTMKPAPARRLFTAEFKADAVRMVVEQGRSAAEVARELNLNHSVLRRWVVRASGMESASPRGPETEKEELARLRKENRELRMERDILKQATVLLARTQGR
jgi:transposase